MAERKHGDLAQTLLAMKKLGFSDEEKDLAWKYINILRAQVFGFFLDKTNEGKEINAKEIFEIADRQCHEGKLLADKVLEALDND